MAVRDPDHPHDATGTVRASARLPALAIDITRRPLPDGTGEQLLIDIRAVPGFADMGRALEAANPVALALEAWRLAWLPWLAAGEAMLALPRSLAALAGPGLLPPGSTDADAAGERQRAGPAERR